MSEFTTAIYRYKRGMDLNEGETNLIKAWKKGIARNKRTNKGPKPKTVALIKRAVELHILGDEAHPEGYSDFRTLAESLGIPYQRLKDLRHEYPKLFEQEYAALIPDAAAMTSHIVSAARLRAMQDIAKRTARAPGVIEEVMMDRSEGGSTRIGAAKDLLGMVGITESGPSDAMQLSKAALDGMKSALDTLGIVVTTQATGRAPLALEAEIVEEQNEEGRGETHNPAL